MKPFDAIIVTNSAGELSTFVRPTVEELSKSAPEARVILTFTPCQYATGRELEEARKLPGISEIIIPEEYKKWVFKKKAPQGIKFNDRGIIVYMGGDLLHAVLLSRKLHFPAIAYSQKHALWQSDFNSFLVPDDLTFNKFLKKGIDEEKIKIIGDLMVDAVPEKINVKAAASRWKINKNHPVISFLPGSRPWQTNFMLPFFLRSAKMINKIMPDVQFIVVLSPYVTDDMIKESLGNEGIIYSQGDLRYIQAESGVRAQILRDERYDAISISDLVITIPGTNTAEIGALGVPMIVVFPIQRPDNIPLEGIIDIICRIPLLGTLLKRITTRIISLRTKYFALPNMKAGREIVPEIRGNVDPKEVAAHAIKCLKDPEWLRETSRNLKAAMGGRGAARKISGEIMASVENAE